MTVKVTKQEELLMARKALQHQRQEVPRVRVKSPLSSEGYITFYKLEHGWTCGECSERVTIAKFIHHEFRKHR